MELKGTDIISTWKKSLRDVLKSDQRIFTQRKQEDTVEILNFQMIISSPEVNFDQIKKIDKERGYHHDTVSDEIYWDTIINKRLKKFNIPEKNTVDQLKVICDRLRKRTYNRQAYATIWSPEEDTISEHPTCILGVYFYIREVKLHMEAMLRSNDAWGQGLNDIYNLVKIQKMVAEELDIPVGSYIHNVMSYHIYDADIEEVEKFLARDGIDEYSK